MRHVHFFRRILTLLLSLALLFTLCACGQSGSASPAPSVSVSASPSPTPASGTSLTAPAPSPAATPAPSAGPDIPFRYFYRSFTPESSQGDVQNFEQALGPHIILNDDAWHAFMAKFCPSYWALLSNVDYSTECLVACLFESAKPSYCGSVDIQSIDIADDYLSITEAEQAATIYVPSTDNASFCFLDIVVVSKSDIPADILARYAYTA